MGRLKAKSDYEELRKARIVENQVFLSLLSLPMEDVFQVLRRICISTFFLFSCAMAAETGQVSFSRSSKNNLRAAISDFVAEIRQNPSQEIRQT